MRVLLPLPMTVMVSPRPGAGMLAIAPAKRLADAGLRAGEERAPWVLARDAAVLALLYGSGLRISEALGLKVKDMKKKFHVKKERASLKIVSIADDAAIDIRWGFDNFALILSGHKIT
jgi:site-specific recombinase XerD